MHTVAPPVRPDIHRKVETGRKRSSALRGGAISEDRALPVLARDAARTREDLRCYPAAPASRHPDPRKRRPAMRAGQMRRALWNGRRPMSLIFTGSPDVLACTILPSPM